MKPTELQAALAKRNNIESQIPGLQKLANDKAARLAELENSCDLSDEKALAEIGRLQALTVLLPRRMAAREAALFLANKELLDAANNFICKNHGPRVRELNIRAEAKVRKELAGHFAAIDLDRMVSSAALVGEANTLGISSTDDPMGGPVVYVERILSLSSKADAFEKKLS